MHGYPRDGAPATVRHDELDTGLGAWATHGVKSNSFVCDCVAEDPSGRGGEEQTKNEFQTGSVLQSCTVVHSRSIGGGGGCGKSLRIWFCKLVWCCLTLKIEALKPLLPI